MPAAALLFFVNVGLPLLFSVLKPWAFTSLALTSFFGLTLDCGMACMRGGRLRCPPCCAFLFGCTALARLAAFGVSCERFHLVSLLSPDGYFVSCRAYQAAGSARGSAQEDGHFGLSY